MTGATPPVGVATRSKALRQQRANNGADLIKSYVQHSEQRREQARFNTSGYDERCEDDTTTDVRALDALFGDRRVYRARRASVVMVVSPRQSVMTPHTEQQEHAHEPHAPTRPLVKRRLLMDAAHADHGVHAHRPPVAVVAPRLRYKHNLATKLDAVTKNSLWGRRKVVLNDDKNALKTALRNGSPRHASVTNPIMSAPESSRSSGGYSANKELSASELEIKVMTAFRQIVRIWRERRRKAEAKAVSMMNGNSNGAATNKFRRDLSAHSSNVVGIVSRRLIREVPALKFFDDETEIDPVTVAPITTNRASVLVPHKRTSTTMPAPPPQRPLSPSALVPVIGTTPQAERARPRGVCYTLDAFGCRKIKMQSSTSTPSRRENESSDHNGKSEELTLEKAMRRSLHRKMTRRLRSRRQTIFRLSDEFTKSRRNLAIKLRSQLALQQAETKKLFDTRSTLLMADDPALPPYKAQKELRLARLRCKKAHLLEKCHTLQILGHILQHVENTSAHTGLELSSGEVHFLDLFRCVVEENQVLTPIVLDAIRQHLRPQDRQHPSVAELFTLVRNEMHYEK